MSERSRGKVSPAPRTRAPGPIPPVLGPVKPQHVPVEIERILIGGLRGQGVRFLGKVIAQAGMLRGHNVTWLPLFSPSIRTPSKHCTVLVSKEPIGSPLAGVPDIVLAFDQDDFELFKPRIKAGGLLIYDSGAMDPLPEAFRDDIRTIGVPAAELARDTGQPMAANMVMLGAFLGNSRLLDEKSVMEGMRRVIGNSDPGGLLEANKRAVEEGLQYVRERRYMFNRYAYSIFMR